MKFLEKLADLQFRYSYAFIAATVIITLLLGIGILNTHLQTDLSKEMPQELETMKLQKRVSDAFGGEDAVIILVAIDRECGLENSPKDARSVEMVSLLKEIEDSVEKESSVTSVTSAASFFPDRNSMPRTDSGVKTVFENIPSSQFFFNRDYSATFMIVSAGIGTSEEKTERFVSKISQALEGIGKPACVKVTVTGNPPLRVIILNTLRHDLVITIIIATVVIFLLIFVIKRSAGSSLLVMAPLIIGLAWTLGILGWLNIPLSVATAGLGAMILGLGTEYGVFLLERYHEERDKGHDERKSLRIALPSVGSGIIGSGLTTVIGFMALVISPMPMLQNLGKALALGIFCILVATILAAPPVLVEGEKHFGKIKRQTLSFLGGDGK